LQHTKFDNIFAMGDCSNLPTSKTASAITAQIAVARFRAGKVLGSKESSNFDSSKFPVFIADDGPVYDGYTSCPLPVGNYKGVIAEFDYDLKPRETMFWDQSIPSFSNYLIKVVGIPRIYWDYMVKGRREGPWEMRNAMNKKSQ